MLFAHHADELFERLEFARSAIHGEDKLALTGQQPHLLRASGQRRKIWKGIG